ncbi:MAG: orotate phosphoribosyltransferase [Myxococcota bacterium]|nr:orotate phosphoribosyltransferase [Myxococcota bacterium]
MGLSKERKTALIEFMLDAGVLRFGDFVTKSGRNTPYFLNTGEYSRGSQLETLSGFYAEAIQEAFGDRADNLYGPAYKGIPLVIATSMALHRLYNRDVSVTFNRKEAKDHGEGGLLVGESYSALEAPLNVLLVEDVITAGTSVRESMALLSGIENVNILGLVVSVDRMEKGTGSLSAASEIRQQYEIETVSMVNLTDILTYLKEAADVGQSVTSAEQVGKIEEYYRLHAGE